MNENDIGLVRLMREGSRHRSRKVNPRVRMWLTQSQPTSVLQVAAGVAVGLLLPVCAAGVVSFWIEFVRHSEWTTETLLYWGRFFAVLPQELAFQAATAVCALCWVSRFPNLQRVLALLLFGACLYYDCFVVMPLLSR